ncbi:hypothetical protein ACM46_00635 [Chryseobacterium angstadtii]|uniref:Sugar-binding protein n=1 Tax=Chryseobacterium angstadtii TaxID=558151 RepID=A0A0J7LAY0_9FLAO|nr:hypothetical protein [Chryseobacterium angstadtii]KMQ66105.1 hypothetical protein ACM46_00635 [Chryseobacterium angstadtii]
MRKHILFCLTVFAFIQTYAQEYRDKDFIGSVNYISIPLVNVRFRYLFPYNGDSDKDWVLKNKIKKISYLRKGELEQTTQYLEDGNEAEITFKSGARFKASKDKDLLTGKSYQNDREISTKWQQFDPGGRLVEIREQYSESPEITVMKIYYSDGRVVKTESFLNNKIQQKYDVFYEKNLLTQYISTHLSANRKPGQTREFENIVYRYDQNNNCISIENKHSFGEITSSHYFKYDDKNNLIQENYILDVGPGTTKKEGTIQYTYDNLRRATKVVEVRDGKKSIAEIHYGENNKVKSITVTGDKDSYSSYFPIAFYFEKMKTVYDFKYDHKDNLIEYIAMTNGNLDNKAQYIIEYY